MIYRHLTKWHALMYLFLLFKFNHSADLAVINYKMIKNFKNKMTFSLHVDYY